jgi:hypothetical protein
VVANNKISAMRAGIDDIVAGYREKMEDMIRDHEAAIARLQEEVRRESEEVAKVQGDISKISLSKFFSLFPYPLLPSSAIFPPPSSFLLPPAFFLIPSSSFLLPVTLLPLLKNSPSTHPVLLLTLIYSQRLRKREITKTPFRNGKRTPKN